MKRALSVVMLMLACTPPSQKPPVQSQPQSAESICDDELRYFDERVWQPTMGITCIGCHNAEGTARSSRMVLKAGALEENFRTVKSIALVEVAGISTLLLRPTGRHPDGHTGGALVAVGSEQYAGLDGFVRRVKTAECEPLVETLDCSTVTAGKPVLRRLTHDEYSRTIRDLLHVDTTLGRDFSPDTVVHGFSNNASVLEVSPLLADQYRQAAEDLAAQVDVSSMVPCSDGPACAVQFIRDFGERAFRRPLTASEAGRYQSLFTAAPAFDEGIRWVIEAMLQSPGFLYRPELGTPGDDGNRVLSPWEIASELSYLLTGSMPDDALFDAARSGALDSPDEIAAHAARLLESPSSRTVLDRFIDAWLLTNRLENTPKDAMTYPEFSSTIRAAMRDELARYVAHVVFEGDGTLTQLLTSPEVFADGELAAFYGPASAHRRGIMTLGPVIAVHSKPNASSPVYRGKVIRERLLCQELAPPPPGVVAQPPPLDPTTSSRERYLAHSTVEPCASCHRLMDPIGFAFDRFDGIGRVRDTENGHPIDDSGEIVGSPSTDGTFAGTAELSEKLAQSVDVQDCFVTQWVRFGYGVDDGSGLQCATRELQSAFRGNGLNIKSLMLSLTRSPHFTQRLGETIPDAGMPETPDAGSTTSDLDVTRTIDSSWETGWCEQVTVTNTGTIRVRWEVTLDVDGTIEQHWNAEREGDAMQVTFRGAMWNADLMPSESASFGFCARRGFDPRPDAGVEMDAGLTTPDAGVTTEQNGLRVTEILGTEWGAGYCKDVIVQNPGTSDVTWSITLSVEGTIYNAWECTRSGDSGDVRFSGPDGRTTLRAGAGFQFGFCANR